MRRCICEERPFALTSARAVAQEISANLRTCSPFTLRVASIHHPSMTSEHESMLREAASKLRVFLQASGVTGHPILAAPDTLDLEALVQLGAAIEQCLPSTEWQLFVCRYGLKTEAGAFFGKLLNRRGQPKLIVPTLLEIFNGSFSSCIPFAGTRRRWQAERDAAGIISWFLKFAFAI